MDPQPANSKSLERFRKREGTVVILTASFFRLRCRLRITSNCDSWKEGGGSWSSFWIGSNEIIQHAMDDLREWLPVVDIRWTGSIAIQGPISISSVSISGGSWLDQSTFVLFEDDMEARRLVKALEQRPAGADRC